MPMKMLRFLTPGHALRIISVSSAVVTTSVRLRTAFRREARSLRTMLVNTPTLHDGIPLLKGALMIRV
jgi:hypothetical protein